MTQNFRTSGLNRGRSHEENVPHYGLFNGRQYRFNPGDAQCDDCWTRPVRPGARRPPEADSVTPHPDEHKRRLGWSLAWIFMAVLVLFLVARYGQALIPPETAQWAATGIC